MNGNLVHTSWLAASFLGLFGLAEWLYHRLHVKAEYTRKLVHCGTGLLTFLFPVFLDSHWWVLFLCGSFAVMLILSLKYDFLQSINRVDRETNGSLYFPAAVYGCFLAYELSGHKEILFYLPILILAVCDPLAALGGTRWPLGKFSVSGNDKSLMGSGIFALSAFGLSLLLLASYHLNPAKTFVCAAAIACVSSLAEAMSVKGIDNLTIPASVILCLMLM